MEMWVQARLTTPVRLFYEVSEYGAVLDELEALKATAAAADANSTGFPAAELSAFTKDIFGKAPWPLLALPVVS